MNKPSEIQVKAIERLQKALSVAREKKNSPASVALVQKRYGEALAVTVLPTDLPDEERAQLAAICNA